MYWYVKRMKIDRRKSFFCKFFDGMREVWNRISLRSIGETCFSFFERKENELVELLTFVSEKEFVRRKSDYPYSLFESGESQKALRLRSVSTNALSIRIRKTQVLLNRRRLI